MSAEQVFYDRLRVTAGVTDIVSQKIYPYARPQEEPLPAIVYLRTATEDLTTIHGTIIATKVQMTIECYSATRLGAEQLADAVHAALTGLPVVRTNRTGAYIPELDCEMVSLVYDHMS